MHQPLILPLLLCLFVVIQSGSANASMIGERRFLPLDQASLKHRAAIVALPDPKPAATSTQGMIPIRRAGFMPIKRDILTIRRSIQAPQLADSDGNVSPRRPPSQLTSRKVATRNIPQKRIDVASAEPPPEAAPASNASEAIMRLFGDAEIEKGHPFLK